MDNSQNLILSLSKDHQALFQKRQAILTFQGFVDRVRKNPRQLIRNAAQYLCDTFDHFGHRKIGLETSSVVRFKMFDNGCARVGPIIGGEHTQTELYKVLKSFVRQGYSNKLILLHGPNGSAKSSTIETIGESMQRYSETDAGAVYRFNWIFPTEKVASTRMKGETGPIGFGATSDNPKGQESYALLDDTLIASRIPCEFKDNPVYLIPMPQRETWLRQWIGEAEGVRPEDVELPPYVLLPGLSKRNQLILENLMVAYEGDFSKVMRHVQVERFYYSNQYRVGISTVEPQMSIDAQERQLTMDKNIQNLPAILHNIRFHEAFGELVEANRGFLEFSDMLKRPIEAFKYLLNTVERSTVSLPSATVNLDIVFFGTTNDKHLDAFKGIPDFSSFRGRFELIAAPYLLRPSQEAQIYAADIKAIGKIKKVCPHTVDLLCLWSVMTRLKQPDPDYYESEHRTLVSRLDPRTKVRLYEGESLRPTFNASEESILKSLTEKICGESQDVVFYEGRFGASPREVRMLLHHATQTPTFETLVPMAIFDELERMIKDRTVFEFLQFEPRGKYHDVALFLKTIKDEFLEIFANEVTVSMTLVDKEQYQSLLSRYVEHVVASLKKERIYNTTTGSYEDPSEVLMSDIEKIIGIDEAPQKHRENLLGRVAAYRIENPKSKIDVGRIFEDYLKKIQDHYYSEKEKVVQSNYRTMVMLGTDEEKTMKDPDIKLAKETYAELERRYGYDEVSARACLKFLMANSSRRS